MKGITCEGHNSRTIEEKMKAREINLKMHVVSNIYIYNRSREGGEGGGRQNIPFCIFPTIILLISYSDNLLF